MFSKCRPRRCIAKKRWFPSSSRKRPPSSFTPVPETWAFQSLVRFNLSNIDLGTRTNPIPNRRLCELIADSRNHIIRVLQVWLGCNASTDDSRALISVGSRMGNEKHIFLVGTPSKKSFIELIQTIGFEVDARVPMRQCVWLFRKWQSPTNLNLCSPQRRWM